MAWNAVKSFAVSFEEYLALEAASGVKYEYLDGELYAFAGGTRRHNQVCANIIATLHAVAQGSSCVVYGSDQKVRVSERAYYYPDVTIVCEPDPDPLLVMKPCLVVEVLSPSTASTDRREKLLEYRGCPTLKDYLIVDPERRTVERHFRAGNGAWWREQYEDGVMPIGCLPGVFVTLESFFRGTADG